MRPPKKIEYEKVQVGEMLRGEIVEIQHEREHKFKGFSGGEDTVQEAIRFVFKLDDYKFKHYSRWMKFSYAERSNIYSKYLVKLVKEIQPDADYDIENLLHFRVKTLWVEKDGFQNIESIFPEKEMLPFTTEPFKPADILEEEKPVDGEDGEDVPF